MKHAETQPYHWYERNPRNPWFSRKTGTVELPDTLVHKTNYVLTREELAEYAALLDELTAVVSKETAAVLRARRALVKGSESQWAYNDNGPRVVTLCDVLELLVGSAKLKLKLMQLLNVASKRRVDESVHSRQPTTDVGEAQGVVDRAGGGAAGDARGDEPATAERVTGSAAEIAGDAGQTEGGGR